MPVTRSQTRGGQPPPRVTSLTDGGTSPRRLANPRQGQAVVNDSAGEGSPPTSDSLANGDQPSGRALPHGRCMTCPNLFLEHSFSSNVTKKNLSNH